MNDNRWTPMLRLRYRFAMARRGAVRRWDRARHFACKRTRHHVTDGWCRRCGTLTIHIQTTRSAK